MTLDMREYANRLLAGTSAMQRRRDELDLCRYRWLRNARGERGDPESAALWEELLTQGCTGDVWDATVDRLMELDHAD